MDSLASLGSPQPTKSFRRKVGISSAQPSDARNLGGTLASLPPPSGSLHFSASRLEGSILNFDLAKGRSSKVGRRGAVSRKTRTIKASKGAHSTLPESKGRGESLSSSVLASLSNLSLHDSSKAPKRSTSLKMESSLPMNNGLSSFMAILAPSSDQGGPLHQEKNDRSSLLGNCQGTSSVYFVRRERQKSVLVGGPTSTASRLGGISHITDSVLDPKQPISEPAPGRGHPTRGTTKTESFHLSQTTDLPVSSRPNRKVSSHQTVPGKPFERSRQGLITCMNASKKPRRPQRKSGKSGAKMTAASHQNAASGLLGMFCLPEADSMKLRAENFSSSKEATNVMEVGQHLNDESSHKEKDRKEKDEELIIVRSERTRALLQHDQEDSNGDPVCVNSDSLNCSMELEDCEPVLSPGSPHVDISMADDEPTRDFMSSASILLPASPKEILSAEHHTSQSPSREDPIKNSEAERHESIKECQPVLQEPKLDKWALVQPTFRLNTRPLPPIIRPTTSQSTQQPPGQHICEVTVLPKRTISAFLSRCNMPSEKKESPYDSRRAETGRGRDPTPGFAGGRQRQRQAERQSTQVLPIDPMAMRHTSPIVFRNTKRTSRPDPSPSMVVVAKRPDTKNTPWKSELPGAHSIAHNFSSKICIVPALISSTEEPNTEKLASPFQGTCPASPLADYDTPIEPTMRHDDALSPPPQTNLPEIGINAMRRLDAAFDEPAQHPMNETGSEAVEEEQRPSKSIVERGMIKSKHGKKRGEGKQKRNPKKKGNTSEPAQRTVMVKPGGLTDDKFTPAQHKNSEAECSQTQSIEKDISSSLQESEGVAHRPRRTRKETNRFGDYVDPARVDYPGSAKSRASHESSGVDFLADRNKDHTAKHELSTHAAQSEKSLKEPEPTNAADQNNTEAKISRRSHRERRKPDCFAEYIDQDIAAVESGVEMNHETLLPKEATRPPRRSQAPLRKSPQKQASSSESLATEDKLGWSQKQLEDLRDANKLVDPVSATFWDDVASMVEDKSSEECRDRWFALTETPAVKPPKGKKGGPTARVEDDLFQSTPLRIGDAPGTVQATNMMNSPMDIDLGSAIKVNTADLRFAAMPSLNLVDEKLDNAAVHHRRGHKTYIQNMRRDVSRAQKERKKTSKKQITRGPKSISEGIFDSEADMAATLTPGGTLKMSCASDDEDDFWDEMYNCENYIEDF